MKAKGGEIRRSTARKANIINKVFSEALEAHEERANNLPCTMHWKSIRAEMTIQKIWDDALDRIFQGASKQLDEGRA